jgi:hypothetical protein
MITTAFIQSDKKGQPNAPAYYRRFPQEPTPGAQNLTVASIKPLPSMTVVGLLRSILKTVKSQQNILLVTHGMDQGPSIPLVPQCKVSLQRNALELFEQLEKGEVPRQFAAGKLRVSPAQLDRLLELIGKVRALGLNRVDLRACNVGAEMKNLEMLKRFFGCATFCAPADLDVFAPINVDPGPSSISLFSEKHPDVPLGGTSPHRYGVYVDIGTVDVTAAFESQRAVKEWIAAHLPPGGVYAGGNFLAHGMIPSKGKKNFIWAGEPEYRPLLVEA